MWGGVGEAYIREEVLSEKLGETVKAIQIGKDKLEWIKDVLKLSHHDERGYHDKILKTLHTINSANKQREIRC